MKKKHFLVAVAFATMAFTFSACRDDASTTKTGDSAKDSGSAKVDTPAKKDNSSGDIVCITEENGVVKSCIELLINTSDVVKTFKDNCGNNGRIEKKCPDGADLACKVEGSKFHFYDKKIADMKKAMSASGVSLCSTFLPGSEDI